MSTTASLAPRPVGILSGQGLDPASLGHGPVSTPTQGRFEGAGDHDGDRHAHGHDPAAEIGHVHAHEPTHDHGHDHRQAPARAVTVPRFSMVQASVTSRLVIAGGLSALVWLAVLWARAPIVPAVLP